MAKSNKVVPKKRRGRPATGRDPVTAIRLSTEMREGVDAWAATQDDDPSRSEAIRRLVEIGLSKSEPPKRPTALSTAKQSAARAVELAGDTIDKHSDQSASTDERKDRKRRLIQGPSVFRETRKDRPIK